MSLRLISLCILLLALFPALHAQNRTIEFVENKGQWNDQVKFRGDIGSTSFFIRKNGGYTVQSVKDADFRAAQARVHGHAEAGGAAAPANEKLIIHSHSYNVNFLGSKFSGEWAPDKPLEYFSNYFHGADPSRWASECRVYQGITVKNIYPNIDVRYYTDNGLLKYDFIVHPGGNPANISLQYEGVDKLSIEKNELRISTSVGDSKELSPYAYQYGGEKGRQQVNCRYEMVGKNVVHFSIKNYDPTQTLVIDPSVIFVSFSGSQGDNWGFTATYGPDGSMFGGGIALTTGFPVSPGAFQSTYVGGGSPVESDISIIRLSANGSQRLYATYIGGDGADQPHSLIADGSGNLVIAGRTSSALTGSGAYPVLGAGGGISGGDGYDIVITKLNASGSALIGSRRIGGKGTDGVNIKADRGPASLQYNYGDDGRSEVILDKDGSIYVASCTQSTDFPIIGNVFQTSPGGAQDGVLIKLSPDAQNVIFSSYLGGSGDDAAYVLAFNPLNDEIYVGGGTASPNLFPGAATGGTIGSSNQGGRADGFVARVSNNGSTLIKGTYLGTPAYDQVYGLKFDQFGYPYVMGQTLGSWPVINAAYSNANSKQFIAKLEPDLSAYVYSTVFGNGSSMPNISPIAFLVDRCENVYVSGWGGEIGEFKNTLAGTRGLPVTPDANKPTTDGNDFYFFVLQKNASAQLYGSFFGQNGGFIDHVDGGTSRFDENGVIYQAICANCVDPVPFPTTPGVWAPSNPASTSSACNLAMVKIAFNLAGIYGAVSSSINGVPRDSSGCVPLTVDFSDTIQRARSYEWNFGDGSPQATTTTPNISHTYLNVGTYRVMMIAIDSNTCNVRDTSYMHIRVGDLEAFLSFNVQKVGACESIQYRFNNTSVAPGSRPFTDSSFVWDFGDGSPTVVAGLNSNIVHTYPATGTYNVILRLIDSAYCNSPDADTLELRVAPNVDAIFETPPTGCAPYEAMFNNVSIAGQSFQWSFGDGSSSTELNPTHLYQNPGTYTVQLIAVDPNTCNVSDTMRQTITVYGNPTAGFSVSPVPPQENLPANFTNLSSSDAIDFFWSFGDGDTLRTNSRADIQHQYEATGTFDACLVVTNVAGCPDTLCMPVQAIVNPLIAVPNAFTPNSGDVNSVVIPRSFGVSKLRFTIYNRQGVKVFESTSTKVGWDGRYKGMLQPMDVYAYTLYAEFFDGTKTTKTGDITLIR